eukprot:CAMPEP_0201552128 /NCGR_PEP_ID=MMETSP0173_2-20130828/14505_1 /ASSEMBLY_ACC=CAM_ASM_000268 /TAXON_ID=218659 /ORGANISM="Vexillifera sp., Strain DIVA3 564/2" /LENGTH=263 /DNA_ID=CAMNT_0047962555 /DNA_START=51 /DNA_END=842 /DNA_ORIENTATION=+
MTDIDPPTGPLRGWLLKKGVKGPAKTWKRRWFKQEDNVINYFVSKDDNSSKMGSISLEEVISVHPTNTEKRKDGKAAFRLNTPQRIYNLMADNEELMTYWVNGLVAILKEQTRQKAGGLDGSELQKKLEAEQKENARLHKALELACSRANLSVQEILAEVDSGVTYSGGNTGATAAKATNNSDSQSTANQDSAGSPDASPAFQPFRAKVLYDFTATRNEQLSLSVGGIITVEGKHEGGWWSGVDSQGSRGFFPGSYCVPISDS